MRSRCRFRARPFEMSFFFPLASRSRRVQNLRGAEDAREKKQQKTTLPFFEKQNESDDGQKHVARCEVVVFFSRRPGRARMRARAFYVQARESAPFSSFQLVTKKKKIRESDFLNTHVF